MSDPVREALKGSMDRNDMWSALDKPKWTGEPPKEPGWYWYRLKPIGPHPSSAPKVANVQLLDGEFYLMADEPWLKLRNAAPVTEWWPIPIQVPEEEE